MTKQEIETAINNGTFMYNQNDSWAVDFWTEAVKKTPELVKKDFKELNEFCINEEKIGAFELNDTYKEILKPLNL